jgi:ribosome-interacting GTPase 1
MPTNLPPEYFEVEKRYRAASSTAEKIATLEELISTIPKHKGTDRLRADFRRRLSKLKSATQGKKGVSKQESVYRIDKEGEGQLAVIGPTNVGKSALVAALTNATPEVSEAPFSTWQPTPGMMPIENVQVQLIDTPPLNRDFVEPQLLDLIRRADIMLLVVDLQADPFQQLEDTIALLEEHHIAPLHLQARYTEERPPTFVPLLVLVNKHDDESLDEDLEIFLELLEGEWPLLPVSAATGRNLEGLKGTVYEQLDIMRIYSKPPGKEPDFSAPFVLERGSSVEEFARKVHRDFFEQLKMARVWGRSATFDGQMVGREHVLQDGDVVELRM